MLEQLKPGDPFPPERELEHQFGVSRITVRQALQQLVLAGRLEWVRLAESEPMALEKVRLPAELFAELEETDLSDRSLYE